MTLTAMDLVAEAKQLISEMTVESANSKLSAMRVLDVREPAEFEASHLPGAIHIPRGVLEFKIGNHPELKDKFDEAILVYCQSGGRSALATATLNKMGYKKAVSMAGGINAWSENGYDLD